MNISLDNLNKKDHPKAKRLADILLYTLPVISTGLISVPIPEHIQLWCIFILNTIVVIIKAISKFTTETPTT